MNRSPCISRCELLYISLGLSYLDMPSQVYEKPILAKTTKHFRKIGTAQKEDPKFLSARARRLSCLRLAILSLAWS